MKQQFSIYLVGQITADPKTFEWRADIENAFKEDERFNIINPCDFPFAKSLLHKCNGDTAQFRMLEAYSDTRSNILPSRDYTFVLAADIIIANLNIITPEKPMLGSYFELAWAFSNPEKVVIGICYDKEKQFHCNHPFVSQTVHSWVKNHIEAIELVQEMF